jgi:hypothetical protein
VAEAIYIYIYIHREFGDMSGYESHLSFEFFYKKKSSVAKLMSTDFQSTASDIHVD